MSVRSTRVTVTSATMFAAPSSVSPPSSPEDFLEHEGKSNRVKVKVRKHITGVILSPSNVILSEAKNLRSWLRVNSAKNLALRSSESGARGRLQVMWKKDSEQDSSLRSE